MPAAPLPILVLLPGMDGTGLMFKPFLRALTGFEPRVVRYPQALTSYAACAAFARAQLPVDRPFLLLGESFSGPVAIALAAERPAGLQGVILCVTFARNPLPKLAWATPLLRALPPMQLPVPLLRRLLLGLRPSAELTGLATSLLQQLSPATVKGRILAAAAIDHTALLQQIQVPILALRASRDRLIPRATTDWIRAHRPDLDIVTLKGPHWLLQTRPEACVQAIQDFVRRNQP